MTKDEILEQSLKAVEDLFLLVGNLRSTGPVYIRFDSIDGEIKNYSFGLEHKNCLKKVCNKQFNDVILKLKE